MSEPLSISDLISNWRTIADFASDVGCGYEAARKMRDRESIAPEHWAKVISASAVKGIVGVTYEWLARHRVPSAAGSNPAIVADTNTAEESVPPECPGGAAKSDPATSSSRSPSEEAA